MDEILEIKQLVEQIRTTNEKKVVSLEEDSKESKGKIECVEIANTELKGLHDKLKSKIELIEAKMVAPSSSNDEKMEAETKMFNLIRYSDNKTSTELKSEEFVEYKNAFSNYLKHKGDVKRLTSHEMKSIEAGRDSRGGYLLVPSMLKNIVDAQSGFSDSRRLFQVSNFSSEITEFLYNSEEFGAVWSSEARTKDATKTAIPGRRKIETHILEASPPVTPKMLELSTAIDVQNWVSSQIARAFSKSENQAFVDGSGVGKPLGILTAIGKDGYDVREVPCETTGKLIYNDLINLYYDRVDFDPFSAQAGSFVMSPIAYRELMKEKGTDGHPVILEKYEGNQATRTFLGRPVEILNQMPATISGVGGTFTAGQNLVLFGDMKESYLINDARAMSLQINPYRGDGYVYFETSKYIGGGVLNDKAFTVLKSI